MCMWWLEDDSLLHRVAVCCSMCMWWLENDSLLQRVAVCCSMCMWWLENDSLLQRVAVCCSMCMWWLENDGLLQCVAVCCCMCMWWLENDGLLQRVAVCCSMCMWWLEDDGLLQRHTLLQRALLQRALLQRVRKMWLICFTSVNESTTTAFIIYNDYIYFMYIHNRYLSHIYYICTSSTVYTQSAPEASWRVFEPVTLFSFDLYHYLEQNGAFGLVPEHAPGPSSQVLPGCRVRHPLGSKKVLGYFR